MKWAYDEYIGWHGNWVRTWRVGKHMVEVFNDGENWISCEASGKVKERKHSTEKAALQRAYQIRRKLVS